MVSFSYEENKFALRFTPTFYPARIVRLQTLVNNNGEFDFTIHKDSIGLPGEKIAGPYRVSATGVGVASAITKTLPGEDPPLLKEGDYWVVVNYLPELPGNPGIGVDVNAPISDRGYFYLSSTGWQYFASGNLMITSFIADTVSTISSGESENKLPLTFQMNQNYPNPFNPSTIISYQIPQSEFVTLEIFNALGEKVNSLINQFQNAGTYSIQWDGDNFSGSQVSSGIYFYRIKAGNLNSVKKMILLR
ncbi:MAG: T9SS type A sorting domain-containing protein [Ignavibacteriales bacterium]|nr:T9SS type A sorting domain-containing protein [Ignavibacteriales bacterium]